jgi:hypothetical protein
MKVKELIEKLKAFDENLEVIGTYPYYDTPCGKDRWELTSDVEFYTSEVIKNKDDYYTYEEVYVGDKVVPHTKETVLILDL